MWSDDKEVDAVASELQRDLDARTTRQLFAEGRGPGSVAQAYQLQRGLRRVREARGEHVAGFKIGYTSPTIRRNAASVMGLTESVHGYLWDKEQHNNQSTVDHRRLGIEGELGITLIDASNPDVAQWKVQYEPVIELHAIGMDGPASDNQGRRGFELIGTNCVHTGVVHSSETITGLLGEIPLNAPMTVDIDGSQIETVTLSELQVGGVYGPVGTVSWLVSTLQAEGQGEERLIQNGTTIICSTPGGLHPVHPEGEVCVRFCGLETTCLADPIVPPAST